MNEILMKLDTVLNEGNVLIADLRKQKENLNRSQNILEGVSSDLNKKIKDIEKREGIVSQIENLVGLKNKAHDLMTKAMAERDGLNVEKKTFENYRQTETARLNDLRMATKKESDLLEEQKKHIEAEVDKRVNEFIGKFKKVGK